MKMWQYMKTLLDEKIQIQTFFYLFAIKIIVAILNVCVIMILLFLTNLLR